MTWTYENKPLEEIPEGTIGFVYEILNQSNGRRYIGKKLFYFSKTKQVKGKKKRTKVESDWRNYHGSNKELQEHVELFGKEKFERRILHLCRTKGEASYLEAKEILTRDAIPSAEYYNEWLSLKVSRSHLPK